MPRKTGQLVYHNLFQAFWNHVIVGLQPNDCWVWTASKSDGYGRFKWNGESYKGHQVSYRLHKGNLKGLQVLHTCDNRACTNPLHLYLGTNDDNIRDRDVRNRVCHGESHHDVKLSNQQVQEIRYKAQMGYTRSMLATEYKCDSSHITRIVNGLKRRRG